MFGNVDFLKDIWYNLSSTGRSHKTIFDSDPLKERLPSL